MKKSGLDGLLITYPRDIQYLTDFTGEDSWLVVTARQLWILSDFRLEEQIARSSPFAKAVIRTKAMQKAAAEVIGDLKLRRIGFQSEHMTVQTHKVLAGEVGVRKLKPINGWLVEQRAVKDEVELKHIRRAIRIQQQAFKQLREEVRLGMTELEITALLENHMREGGGEGPSFPIIVATGPNSSLCHAIPGKSRVRKGQPLLIDFGTVSGGYCSDMTRVLSFGPLRKPLDEVYKVVLEAQQAAIEAIKPGVKLRDVDAVARKIIADAGYGDRFGHGLGHGIGLDIHEQPVLSGKVKGLLQPGHVVTVEPGIYLPGVGGIRIEDDVEVTAKGRRVLSNLPKTPKSAII
jgi:Xaa-Pro aminopeptidase